MLTNVDAAYCYALGCYASLWKAGLSSSVQYLSSFFISDVFILLFLSHHYC